jgi:hypothetical protein
VGYLFWPFAALSLVQEAAGATMWSRLHARQALAFGLLATFLYGIVLAVPLVVVLAVPAISPGAILGVYTVGLVIDIIAAVAVAGFALSLYRKARRGALFRIVFVTPIVDRFFPIDGVREKSPRKPPGSRE